ncbi:hypothetical protein ACO1O0_006636 [Amphichorda felina]
MNALSTTPQKITSFLGFRRGLYTVLFIIFGGALLGFSLARLHYISFDGVFCRSGDPKAPPGECYWYRKSLYKAGIVMHLACILPACVLAVFQFVPSIRHHFLIFHRLSGSLIVLLVLASNAGAIIIASRVFGGSVPTQSVTGTAVLLSTFGILNAYYNIKRQQLDQHRAWMMRTFAWMAHVITMRFIQMAAVEILSKFPHPLYETRACVEMVDVAGTELLYTLHPECGPGYPNSTTPGYFTARANWFSEDPYEKTAAGGAAFGMSAWLAFAIHAIAVEIYLAATTREAQRLRQVSYERQLARGFKNPGSAGFFWGKFGDVEPFVPKSDSRGAGEERTESRSAGEEDAELEKRNVADSAASSA